MYIMVKTHQNLDLLAGDLVPELSILESRKHNQANLCLAEDYNLDLLQNGLVCAVKRTVVKEDFGNPLH